MCGGCAAFRGGLFLLAISRGTAGTAQKEANVPKAWPAADTELRDLLAAELQLNDQQLYRLDIMLAGRQAELPGPADWSSDSMNNHELESWVSGHETGNGVHKFWHYLQIYPQHFSKYKAQDKVVMIEVGVQSGGSIDMWRDYFGPDKLEYYGIDLNPATRQFERPGVHISIGDQANRSFWQEFKMSHPKADIIIDDGGHTNYQQVMTLDEMFWHLVDGGMYLVEDVCTSYWRRFGGGHFKKDTIIEQTKLLIDLQQARHSMEKTLQPDRWTMNLRSMHFYDSMIFLEKGPVAQIQDHRAGNYWIPDTR